VPGATVTSDPVVIFEVFSKGPARVDRVEKNREYRTITSVTHDVMLEQEPCCKEPAGRRDGATSWCASHDADGGWASKLHHPVEDVDGNGDLGILAGAVNLAAGRLVRWSSAR